VAAESSGMSTDSASFLHVDGLDVVYDEAIEALRGVSFDVPEGRIVSLLGVNGAGKTTTLRAISNLLGADGGSVRRGTITWQGEVITGIRPSRLVARGLVQVLEGRHCFPQLTVEENLLTGGYVRRLSSRRLRDELDRVYHWLPRLRERRRSRAGVTSGGEQQMIAIGRALMTGPRLVLLDEPSMGLAPRITLEIFEIVKALNRDDNVTFLISEQNAAVALRYADQAHVLDNGRVVASGPAADLIARGDIKDIYLGGTAKPRPTSRDDEGPADVPTAHNSRRQ
jgi:branched-chain amino acid transport system ATP-binding protein